jgi:hypothetical protein
MWILNSLLDIPANWNEPAEGEMCAGPEARDHENTDSNYPITDVGAPPKYGRHADLHDSHSDFDDSDPCGFVCLRGYYRGGEFDGSENFAKNFDSVEHRANNYCYRPVRPHVNVVGSEKVTIAASSDASDLYIDRGAECFDDPLQCGTHDGTDVCDISDLVTVTGNNVNLARIGTYEILYTCRNKAGLEDTATRQVFVEDQKCPTCKFDEPKTAPRSPSRLPSPTTPMTTSPSAPTTAVSTPLAPKASRSALRRPRMPTSTSPPTTWTSSRPARTTSPTMPTTTTTVLALARSATRRSTPPCVP